MSDIEWHITGRQNGKTHRLIEWVKQGRPVDYYPGWDRVILTSSKLEADDIFRRYPELDSHQVYPLNTWSNRFVAGGIQGPVTLGIDNVEYFLNRMLYNTAYSRIAMITGTGECSHGDGSVDDA